MLRLTIQEIKEISNNMEPIKPKPVKIPESAKKYDKIYLLQESAKRVLGMKYSR